MSKPFFSVVMPTYNRVNLLPFAIQSVLEQTFEDLELVISNGGSTDDTANVIAKFDDKRIRYIESKERLSIGDNYQNALDNTTGEYITFLGDDDAFVPVMFERVLRVIENHNAPIVAFRVSRYYQENDIELDLQLPVSGNTLIVPRFTSEITEFNQSEARNIIFSRYGLLKGQQNQSFITPFLANAVYDRSIFSKLSAKNSKLFAMTPADMYLAAAIFFVTDSYYCLDEPLHVWSHWAGNSTASPNRKGNKLREHYEKLLNGKELEQTPLKFALPHNLHTNAFLQAKNDFVEKTKNDFEIDWANYFVTIYDDLMHLKSIGIEVSHEVREFHEILSEQPSDLQNAVRNQIHKFKFVTKQFIRNNLPFVKRAIKRFVQSDSTINQLVISGDSNNFNNFLEAARFINSQILPKSIKNK